MTIILCFCLQADSRETGEKPVRYRRCKEGVLLCMPLNLFREGKECEENRARRPCAKCPEKLLTVIGSFGNLKSIQKNGL